MFKKVKRLFVVMLGVIALSSQVVPAYSDEKDPYVNVEAYYSSNLVSQEGDTFFLTYRVSGQTETAEIELDAYAIYGEIGMINLPAADYEITEIRYAGANSSIEEDGYAVTTSFRSAADGAGTIILAIGNEQGSRLESMYQNVLVKKGGKTVSSFSNEKEESESEVKTETSSETSDPDTSEKTTEKSESTDPDSSSQHANKEDLVVEKYMEESSKEQEGNDTKQFLIVRGIPILIAVLITGIILFILYKKGII